MSKNWILIVLCVLLSGCIGLGKQSSVMEAQSSDSEAIKSGHVIGQHWIGRYSLYVQSPEVIMEDASSIGIGYDFEIQDSVVSFEAAGFQKYFVCECLLQEEQDRLLLFYKKTIDGWTPASLKNECDTVALIICEQGKYYVQSPIIPNTEWIYNQKMLLEKKPIEPSEEPETDRIPKITYWHENFEYGNEDDCLDTWAVAIDEADFLAALDSYKNMEIDSTVQLSTTAKGNYSLSLENGHTKVLSDTFEKSDDYSKYQYEGFLEPMNCYVFEYEGFEWEGIAYVSKANGEEYMFQNKALFSPNHENGYCIDVGTDFEGERAGIVQVFWTLGGEFKFMFGLWSNKIFPQTVCWQDNTTLYMQALREVNGTDRTYYYKIALDQIK